MKKWLKLALAEDRMLLSLLDYALMLNPGGIQYGNARQPHTVFTEADANRLANLMRDWEDMAIEMTSEGFDPKKVPEYEKTLKEIRTKMLPGWRAADECGSMTIHSVVRRVGIRR